MVLHETFFCGECGYDLTGLHAVGHCPECGNRYNLGSRKGVKQPPSPLDRGDQVVRHIRVFLFGAGAAVAVGIDALFLEVHPSPDEAPSDGPNSLDYQGLVKVLKQARSIDHALRG